MRSIVTGGAGFIGSHLVDRLVQMEHEVIVLDNFSTGRPENLSHYTPGQIKLVECDITKNEKLDVHFHNVDWVFHLAALADIVPSIQNPDNYFNANVNGTFNIVQACRKNNVKRLIYTASSSCYGIPDEYPTPETAEIRPQYPYALTKFLGEEIIMHWCNVYKIPSLSLRFFNVYGPRSRTSGTYGAVFGVFLAQKLNKAPFTVVGDGNQTRDFTFVSDIVSSLVSAAKSNLTGEIYNVGSDATVSVNKIVELLDGNRVFIPKRPGEPDCTHANIAKIKKDLKWKPVVPIEEGVKILIENIDYWKDAPVWDSESINDATKDWFKYLS